MIFINWFVYDSYFFPSFSSKAMRKAVYQAARPPILIKIIIMEGTGSATIK